MHPQMIKKRIFMKRMLRRPDFLWNKIRRRPDFLTKSFLSLSLPFSPSLTRAPSLSVMGLLTPLSLSLSLFLSRSRALSLSLSILCPVNAVKFCFTRISAHRLHRVEFCPPKFFSKIFRFSIAFYSNLQIFGGATFEKHADFEKNNRNGRKSRANSRNLLEPFLRSRKEENLYGHCAIDNARSILSKGSTLLRICYFWSKKHHF